LYSNGARAEPSAKNHGEENVRASGTREWPPPLKAEARVWRKDMGFSLFVCSALRTIEFSAQFKGMSLAGANASAFITEVAESGLVWAIRDNKGYPSSTNPAGECALPFWSKESRAKTIIKGVAAYRNFEPVELPLAEFMDKWLPDLERDGLFVGLNWYGKRAIGYNFTPQEVRARLGTATGIKSNAKRTGLRAALDRLGLGGLWRKRN
jgi:Protein of unknown function (DUF2750)